MFIFESTLLILGVGCGKRYLNVIGYMSWFKDGLIRCTIVQDTIIHKTQQRHIASPQEPPTIKNLPDFPRSMFFPCQGRLKKTVTESICLGGRIPLLGFLKPSLFVFKLKLESWKGRKAERAEKVNLVVQSAFRQKKCYNVIISSHSYLK